MLRNLSSVCLCVSDCVLAEAGHSILRCTMLSAVGDAFYRFLISSPRGNVWGTVYYMRLDSCCH